MSDQSRHVASAPLIVIAGFLVPGLGYAMLGEKMRGLVAGVTITLMFVLGILIGGVRVIDVPGYYASLDSNDQKVEKWKFRDNPMAEILNRPWYMAQVLTGPMNMLASYVSVSVTPEVKQSTSRIFDIGTLYTAVAGMLNLMVIIDSLSRAVDPHESAEQSEGEQQHG